MRYDIRSLAAMQGKACPKHLPIVQPSLALLNEYLVIMKRLELKLIKNFNRYILPAYKRKGKADGILLGDAEYIHHDAALLLADIDIGTDSSADIGRPLFAIADAVDDDDFAKYSKRMEKEMGGLFAQLKLLLLIEAKRHTDAWNVAVEKAVGINLRSVVKKERLAPYLKQAGLRNAGLIRGASADQINKIQLLVYNGALNGTSAKNMEEQVGRIIKVGGKSRFELIARDQTAKINSEMTQIRQQDAGIKKYVWRSSQDEKVRSRHAAIDGKEYAWGEPTGAEDGLPPGQPIRCRCTAQAIIP